MSKSPLTKPEQSEQPVTKVTLHEFCKRKSTEITRPEIIGSFEYVERAAGRLSDTESAYKERFDAFINKPI